MEHFHAAAVITELADRLLEQKSWCSETHIQKAVYFLQDVLGVPIGLEYILYKHGPYSFDLTEKLMSLRADFLLEKVSIQEGYGPQLRPTKESRSLRERFPKTLDRYSKSIEFISTELADKRVADLEKLATALWVTRKLGQEGSALRRAEMLHALKPHISLADAQLAIRDFDALAERAKEFALLEPMTN